MFEVELHAEAHRNQLLSEAEQHRLAQSDANFTLSLRLPFKSVALFGLQWWNNHFHKEVANVMEAYSSAVNVSEAECVECGVPA